MWDFFLGLPFNFPTLGRNNYNTIPSAGVTVGTDAVTIELPAHSLYRRNYVPLMETEGTPVTVANITGAGIYEIHYNRYTNELYLVNGGYRPTEAAAAAAAAAPVAQGQDAATADFNDFNK